MQSLSPPTLRECLAATPMRNLRLFARLHRISYDHAAPKADLVEVLAGAMLRPEFVQGTLRRLAPEQRQALDALRAAGGRMAWPAFREAFGDIRPYRPWREDAPRHPWRAPISPAEGLWFLGLIFRRPRQPRPGQEAQVVIPVDLLALLPVPEGPATPLPLVAPRLERPAAAPDMVTDVALLISLLHRQDIRPLWGRWLPPRCLRDLNQRLSVPEDLDQVRSELQAGRLRFLHFVAEAAGLVAPAGEWLKPTPLAWAWLEESPAARYQTLWQAWLQRSDHLRQLWQQYRLPGHRTGVALDAVAVLLGRLADLAEGTWYAVAPFVAALAESEPVLATLPPVWHDDEVREQGSEVVAALLTGPLSWWGVVVTADQDGEPAFAVSRLGRWLIAGQGSAPQPAAGEDPPATEPWLQVGDDLALVVSGAPPLRDLVRIEAVAEWRGWVAGERCYQVTQESLSHALARSLSLPEVLDTLSRGQGRPLDAVPWALLRAWADETEAVRIRRVTLLETRDAERMRQLGARRGVHQHFRETLSPRAVVVDGRRVAHLVRALRRQGVWPRVDLPAGEASDDPLGGVGAVGVLWIAARVYAQLGRWIELPQPMPAAVLDDLAAQMGPEVHAVAREAAEDVIDRLADVVDGWALYPMPEAGLSPEETLPAIEQAIAEGRVLRLTYWTAGRGERTTRTVEPLRIEWRGDVPYLIAYCHERREDRVFRVDRVQKLEVEG